MGTGEGELMLRQDAQGAGEDTRWGVGDSKGRGLDVAVRSEVGMRLAAGFADRAEESLLLRQELGAWGR